MPEPPQPTPFSVEEQRSTELTGSRLFRFYLLNTLTFKNREHAHDCLNGNTWMHTCTVSPGESRAGQRGKSDWQDAL